MKTKQKVEVVSGTQKTYIVVLEHRLGGKKVYLKGFSLFGEANHETTLKREQALKISCDQAEQFVKAFNGNRLYSLAHVEKAVK